MWTMGDDFQYQYAESWFKQMDKLIHYVNKVNFHFEFFYLFVGNLNLLLLSFIPPTYI